MLIKDGAIQFEPREIAIIFKKFYSVLANDVVKGLPIAPNKCCSSTTEDYCADMFNKKNPISATQRIRRFLKRFRLVSKQRRLQVWTKFPQKL